MKEHLVIDLLESVISGEWGNEPNGEQDVYVLRTTNFTNNGKIDFSKEVVKRNINEKKVESKKINYGDIIIEKSGGSVDQPVGRVVYFDLRDNNNAYLCNNFTAVLRPNTRLVNPKFLFYFLFYLYKCKAVLKFQNQTTGIINLKLDNYLRNSSIFMPMLEEQEHIVKILDKAQTIIDIRKKALIKLDELVQAVFLDMFGDLRVNNKNWSSVCLSEIAEIASGITKGKKYNDAELVSVPYMRVANVQDGYVDLSEIKEIEVSHNEAVRYRLQSRDVLLTEGGDPDKLGRGAVWTGTIKECIHQNHIFRVRVNEDILNPYFFSACAGSEYGKNYFLRMAKQTTGIATINMTQLKSFIVFIPPIELQNRFEQLVKTIEAKKQLMNAQLLQLESNFQALLQKAFKGELKVKDGVAV